MTTTDLMDHGEREPGTAESDLVDGQTATTGQTEEDLRLHGWKGERVLDNSDKPNTETVPDPSRRRTGTPVNPER